ncbi:efflux RND transporter periplasmic adaptor subunit [Phaeodactylibacter luteus]|uniref:HlyD family efflux transporter periplasmic adaptor subunit n=1 Tax=Phaeodactylibacter luteus TaxID=1564516 RepID=A0A5C6RFJ4_9BACT|nr:HlyD family efflux transporter periplasmic adaptor subunit [Phaeodactylibacter luteus]TXB60572.1 HlyD family efflux transporter periplasmic adaptor subunit [Phaeodactylibacter luteus]
MDRPISQSTQRKRRFSTYGKWGALAMVLLLSVWGVRSALTTRLQPNAFQTARIERGAVEQTVTATGLVIPAFEQQLAAPIGAPIQAVLRHSGDQVKRGDTLLLLDAEYTRLQFESLSDQLELKQNNLKRLSFEYDKQIRDLSYESSIKALQISSLEAQLADAKHLKSIGSATQEEVDQAQLQLEIAELEKQKLDNELQFRKAVLPGDRRNLELEAQMEVKKRQELERKLREASVTAPRAGVITWINEDLGKQVQEGELLAKLADLERYRIEASCSDRYAQQVKVGMPARVRVNRTDLPGRITAILPAVENNTLSFIIELDEPNHSQLRPNLRVEVFLIAGRREQVLRLKNAPVFTGQAEQPLFVIKDGEAVKTTARVGLTSIDYVELLETDLKEGQEVIISDMKAYNHLERLQIQ